LSLGRYSLDTNYKGAPNDEAKIKFTKKNANDPGSVSRLYSRDKAIRGAKYGAAGLAAAGGLAAGAKYLYDRNQKKKAAAAAAAAAQNRPAPPTQPAHIKGSANTQRGGYSEFEGNGRVREDWEYFDDPGAQMILESYFSEFGDADVFGGPEPEYDNYNEEWDY
jgi:hypothetical protein